MSPGSQTPFQAVNLVFRQRAQIWWECLTFSLDPPHLLYDHQILMIWIPFLCHIRTRPLEIKIAAPRCYPIIMVDSNHRWNFAAHELCLQQGRCPSDLKTSLSPFTLGSFEGTSWHMCNVRTHSTWMLLKDRDVFFCLGNYTSLGTKHRSGKCWSTLGWWQVLSQLEEDLATPGWSSRLICCCTFQRWSLHKINSCTLKCCTVAHWTRFNTEVQLTHQPSWCSMIRRESNVWSLLSWSHAVK